LLDGQDRLMADIGAIRDFIEAERARFAVPGVAVAVVHEGEVVLCEGFGHADLETGRRTDADTQFPLASDTKAFTAATLCLLADAGLVDLDAPVREVLPWFAMHDPHATALVTPRDLLSHRTGLPRHDLVWFGDNPMSLEETTRRLRHLPLSQPLRTAWDYNNLCYIAAGHLTEALAGTPWHEAVSARLLRPLGMTSTVFSAQDADAGRLARPYKATSAGFARQEPPARATADKAGPAGGIVSSAADLAQWLLARLGRRTDAVPASVLDQLHRPAMLGGIAFDRFAEILSLGYGLGCQVESYRGRRIVHHGGNITGYSSDVCVVPGTDTAIAVLTNLDSSNLRLPLLYGILDLLSGNSDADLGARIHELQTALESGHTEARDHQHARASEAPPSRPLTGFAGTYTHPAYGELTIRVEGDKLVPDFHEAGDRIQLAHRGYDAWDLVVVDYELDCPLVFTQGPDGAISGLAVSMEPSVAPTVFTRRHEQASAELLAAMVGGYRMGPTALTIRLRGTELVATSDILGDLALVAAGGTAFSCSTLPGIGITAELDPDGTVARIIVDQVGIFTPEAS
jgi:CubicO group peptidase (beta-lactamase class C family)